MRFDTAIFEHAKLRPDAPAVVYPPGYASPSYARMADDIVRTATWLDGLRLAPGARVVLHGDDRYLHWVLFFALELHGAISFTVSTGTRLDRDQIAFLGAAHILSHADRPADIAEGMWTRIDGDWYAAIRGLVPDPRPRHVRQPDDIVTIVMSSGTTGTAKKAPIRRAALVARAEHVEQSEFMRPGGRFWCEMPPTSIGALMATLAIWNHGGALCCRAGQTSLAEQLDAMGVDAILAAPGHIEQMLTQLPADRRAPPAAVCMIGGGLLSRPLEARVRTRIAGTVLIVYGITEAGQIARLHSGDDRVEGNVGAIEPYAEVSILDEHGRECATGAIGEIRLRGVELIDHYLDDPEATARAFRDGWYHPGDLGCREADGTLRIAGRIDDLMELGGYKVLPEEIERALLAIPGVREAAAYALRDEQGSAVLGIAYVADHALGREEVAPLAAYCRKIRPRRMEALPRNAMGKIERAVLRNTAP